MVAARFIPEGIIDGLAAHFKLEKEYFRNCTGYALFLTNAVDSIDLSR